MSFTRSLTAGLFVALLLLSIAPRADAHIVLDAPNGGETLSCGSSFLIQWHPSPTHGKDDYDLEYSTTGLSGTWLSLTENVPPTQTSFLWEIPNTPSGQVFVRVIQDLPDGTFYDDFSDAAFSITNDVFVDLGSGKPGAMGVIPSLTACGQLTAGSTGSLTLIDAAPNAPMLLVGALSPNPVPFLGGTLIPGSLQIILPFTSDPQGSLELPVPGGFGPLDVYLQFVVVDPTATQGVALSNAGKLTW